MIMYFIFIGLPNGFGVHVAYSRKRIITVFPIEKDKTD